MARQPTYYDEGSKLSREFAARLERLPPGTTIRVILMLDVARAATSADRRLSAEERQAAIAAIRQSAAPALPKIDEILQSHKGKRLSNEVNALGSIAVETTPKGIISLAQFPFVKAIIEDQKVSQLKPSLSR